MGKAEKPVEGDQGQPEDVSFSIITPVYNAGKLLNSMVESVLNQNYKRFELLLVDDGSTDGSAALCDKWEKEDGRIRVFYQKNQGPFTARERGIEESSGEYLLFADADDMLEEGALSTLAHAIFCGHKPDIFLYNGWIEKDGQREPLWPEEKEGWIDADTFREKILEGRRYNQIWLKAFRRKLLTGGKVNAKGRNVRSEEDLLMQLPWISAAQTVYCLPDRLYRYRVHAGSLTQNLEKNKLSDALYMHQTLYYYALYWKVREGRKKCNTRLLEDTITYAKKALSEKNRFALLHELAGQEEIREIFHEKWDDLTGKQRFFLNILLRMRIPEPYEVKNQISKMLRNRRSIMRSQDFVDGVALEWWDYRVNLGDLLSPVIVRWMKEKTDGRYMQETKEVSVMEQTASPAARKRLLALGSILGMEAYDATVWGSGVHTDRTVSGIFRNRNKAALTCLAVRGPVTEAVLQEAGYQTSGVYGDPAILLPWIYPKEEAKKDLKERSNDRIRETGTSRERIVLIRHYMTEKDRLADDRIHCVNIQTSDYKDMIQRIVASGKVISSALHGIILAECYGIPAVFLRQGVEREEMKYLDWYRSTGRETFSIADSLEEALRIPPSPMPDEEKLEEMRKNLFQAFPDLWHR